MDYPTPEFAGRTKWQRSGVGRRSEVGAQKDVDKREMDDYHNAGA